MSEMICKREITGGIGLEYEYTPVQKLVRCKDCVRRGNADRCMLAYIAKEQGVPYTLYDEKGEWFCKDGERKG